MANHATSRGKCFPTNMYACPKCRKPYRTFLSEIQENSVLPRDVLKIVVSYMAKRRQVTDVPLNVLCIHEVRKGYHHMCIDCHLKQLSHSEGPYIKCFMCGLQVLKGKITITGVQMIWEI